MAQRSLSIANRYPRLRLDRREVARALAVLDGAADEFRGGAPAGELSVVFLTDRALAKLHADFLADPTITDVITFMGQPELGSAGEICVSVDAALRQVGLRAKPAVFAAELTLYLVHGWLHLAGYDDLEPRKKQAMRRAERRAMARLRTQDCLPLFRVAKWRGEKA